MEKEIYELKNVYCYKCGKEVELYCCGIKQLDLDSFVTSNCFLMALYCDCGSHQFIEKPET